MTDILQLEVRLRTILEAYSLPGRRITYGAQQPRVLLKDDAGMALIITNNLVPTTGTPGFAKGCIALKTDAAYGTPGLYVNVGTTTACLFSLLSTSASGVFYFENTPAAAAPAHAAVEEGAANAFPGPFTNPTIPRSLAVDFAAGWEGGDITIVGTDQFDAAVTEVIADTPGSVVQGVKIFKTITSASKETVAGTTDTATLQTGTKIGILARLIDTVGILLCDNASEAVVLDATYHAFTPTTPPNGAHDYKLMCNHY